MNNAKCGQDYLQGYLNCTKDGYADRGLSTDFLLATFVPRHGIRRSVFKFQKVPIMMNGSGAFGRIFAENVPTGHCCFVSQALHIGGSIKYCIKRGLYTVKV